MGLFNKLKFWGEDRIVKQSAITPSLTNVAYNPAVFTPWKYVDLLYVGYLHNVVVYRCVELGSQLFSQVPWFGQNTKEKEIPDSHPLIKLMKRPNPFQSGVQLRHQARALLRLHGNCYFEKVRGTSFTPETGVQRGVPKELYVIPPERMTIETDGNGNRIFYKYEYKGFIKKWAIDPVTGESDILHIKRFNPMSDFYGFGDLMPASHSTDTHNSIVEYNKALLDNSGNPPGMFSIRQDANTMVTPQQMTQFQENISNYYGGPKNAGKPIVAPNVEYTAMAWSPKDMEWNVSKESVAKDICIAFGVPYVLLNMTDATFSNAEEARLSYFEDQILPELELFRDELNNWFEKDFPNIELMFDVDVLPFMAKKLEARYNAIANMSTILTINECRDVFGFEKLDGFDYIKGAVENPDHESNSDPNVQNVIQQETPVGETLPRPPTKPSTGEPTVPPGGKPKV